MTVVYEQNADGSVSLGCSTGQIEDGDSTYWTVTDDATAATGKYLKPNVPNSHWNKSIASTLTFLIEINTAGTFEFFFRASTSGKSASMWVVMDGDGAKVDDDGYVTFSESDWVWRKRGKVFNLTAGRHELKLYTMHAHVKYDKLALIPTGTSIITDGETGDGPVLSGVTATSDPPPVAPDETGPGYVPGTFQEWAVNPVKNPDRILLIELDHTQGTVCLASSPYLSTDNIAYDDWLIDEPYIDQSLNENYTLGSVNAVNPDPDENWLDYQFHGHQCRMYYGDRKWDKTQHRLIATATIQSIDSSGGRKYSWKLVGNISAYSRTFHVGADVTQTMTVRAAVAALFAEYMQAGTYQFINIPTEDLDSNIIYTLTESTVMSDLLKRIAYSVGAKIRFTQAGNMEIVRYDSQGENDLQITDDYITRGTVKTVGAYNPVSRIKLKFNNGAGELELETKADTGGYDDTLSVETMLVNQADAERLLYLLAEQYANVRRVYSMTVFGLGNTMQVANVISTANTEITVSGIIERIQRRALAYTSTIEFVSQ